jgi:hypothetical protein
MPLTAYLRKPAAAQHVTTLPRNMPGHETAANHSNKILDEAAHENALLSPTTLFNTVDNTKFH